MMPRNIETLPGGVKMEFRIWTDHKNL